MFAMKLFLNSYSHRLLWYLIVIETVIIIRLLGATLASANWRGFIYSALHALVVGLATYLALRKTSNTQKNFLYEMKPRINPTARSVLF
jgi:hypothetical protein